MPRAELRTQGLWLIAAFKLFKGALLLALGIGIVRLLHHDAAMEMQRWGDLFRVDPGNVHFQRLVDRVTFLNHRRLKELGAGTFFYSALMFTEGIGLSLEKRWAEYFSVIATAGFLPLEIYELARRATLGKWAVLAINIAVIVYLINDIYRYQWRYRRR
jgi:uncharacterized membrane protein (DUF2068 family)